MEKNLKETISDTYVQLLSENHEDTIQPNDIIAEIGITKDNFYSRFKNILDVAEWTLYNKMRVALLEANKARTPEEAVIIMMKHVRLNRKLLQKMIKNKKYYSLEQTLTKIIRLFIEKLIEKENAYKNVEYQDLDMALQFYSGGLTSYILNVSKLETYDEATECARISRLFRGDFIMFDRETKIINSKGEVEIVPLKTTYSATMDKPVDDVHLTYTDDDNNTYDYFSESNDNDKDSAKKSKDDEHTNFENFLDDVDDFLDSVYNNGF